MIYKSFSLIFISFTVYIKTGYRYLNVKPYKLFLHLGAFNNLKKNLKTNT